MTFYADTPFLKKFFLQFTIFVLNPLIHWFCISRYFFLKKMSFFFSKITRFWFLNNFLHWKILNKYNSLSQDILVKKFFFKFLKMSGFSRLLFDQEILEIFSYWVHPFKQGYFFYRKTNFLTKNIKIPKFLKKSYQNLGL